MDFWDQDRLLFYLYMISGEVGGAAGPLNVSSTSMSTFNIPLTVGKSFILQQRLALGR